MIQLRWTGTAALLVCITLTLISTGCARYVNIPARSGDVAMHDPNYTNVRSAIIAGLNAVLRDRPTEAPFYIKLPDGTSVESYELIVPQVSASANAWPVEEADAPAITVDIMPVLDVRGLRIRGMTAEVDIVIPDNYDEPTGLQRLAVVSLKKDVFAGWRTDHLHYTRGPAETALMQAPTSPRTINVAP